MKSTGELHNDVKNYYGEVLSKTEDLKTGACCTNEALPKYVKEMIKNIHPEVIEKFYGCGSPIPEAITAKTVLDLGSGSGRDCYIFSQLVGESGRVIGVDMTEEQIAVAQRHETEQMKRFGFQKSNVDFKHGLIEDLESLNIASNSVDVVTSNCVLNLSPEKERVFREIFRVLKPGGELYFSDIFSMQRIPQELAEDPVLRGECLSGAMYIEDFRRLLATIGCLDYRVVATIRFPLIDEQIEKQIGMIDFYSLTIRAFKLDLEDRCEDYGQVAYYLGGIPESPHAFTLDDHHHFRKGMPYPVCGNTADMLSRTRFSEYFKIVGDKSTHYGLFDCVTPNVSANNSAGDTPSTACC